MLNDKKVNIIISLLIAIGLWAFVVGELNPDTTDEKNNIPITFINEDSLSEKGLSVLSLSEDTINLEVTGKRSVIGKLKKDKIEVILDLSLLHEGNNSVKLKTKVPDNVEIKDSNVEYVTVVVEKTLSVLKDVNVEYERNTNTDAEPTLVDVNKKKIAVTGAKTLVNNVDYLKAVISSDKVEDEMKTVSIEVVPVDEKGVIIEKVKLSTNWISVTSVLKKTKTVNLDVKLKENSQSKDTIVINAPKVVTIKGTEKELSLIEKITTEVIDVTNVYEDVQVPINPILPDGIELADTSKKLTVSITVTNYLTKKITIDKENIVIKNIESELEVEIITEPIVVTVIGREDIVNNIKASDLEAYIDLKNLKAGEHEVHVAVSCSEPTKVVENLSIIVNITAKKIENEDNDDIKEE